MGATCQSQIKQTQSEDIIMSEQNNVSKSLAQGKYPWGFIKNR